MKHVMLATLSFAAIAWPHYPPHQRDALHAIVIARQTAAPLPEPPPPPPADLFP